MVPTKTGETRNDQIQQTTRKTITAFAALLKRADDDVDTWARLMDHGAPRVLGDTFLASVAAIVFDSNWRKAKRRSKQACHSNLI